MPLDGFLLMSFLIRTYPRWVDVMGERDVSHLWYDRIIRDMSCEVDEHE